MPGTLYLVATPIGNLKDMTYRAVETLQAVDMVACEDTRHSLTLLNAYGIKKPLVAYHKFNERAESERLLAELEAGKSVALISDAGMPVISDPGSVLVSLCMERGVPYTVIPGANAGLCALVLSGFDASAFSFFGFLPKESKARRALAEKFKAIESTLIFYAPPHGVAEDLKFLYKVLGARKFAAVREITKVHETAEFGVLGGEYELAEKGEYVVIVEGAPAAENPLNAGSIEEHLAHYQRAGMTRMEAVKAVAKDRGVPKNEIYRRTVEPAEKE